MMMVGCVYVTATGHAVGRVCIGSCMWLLVWPCCLCSCGVRVCACARACVCVGGAGGRRQHAALGSSSRTQSLTALCCQLAEWLIALGFRPQTAATPCPVGATPAVHHSRQCNAPRHWHWGRGAWRQQGADVVRCNALPPEPKSGTAWQARRRCIPPPPHPPAPTRLLRSSPPGTAGTACQRMPAREAAARCSCSCFLPAREEGVCAYGCMDMDVTRGAVCGPTHHQHHLLRRPRLAGQGRVAE